MGLIDRLAGRVRDAVGPVDSDLALQASMAACIELAATRYAVDPGAQWEPGNPLKLLLAGYAGSRNTGADVRVEEMIRQFRHLLGDELAELSILTIDPARTRGYFRTVRQLTLPKVFPRFITDTVHQQHGVIACEGSMFKSKFANALSTLMVGALGLAAVENKVAVGYGGEAGKMDPALEAMVRRYCRDALIIARNAESREVLAGLGVESRAGTDTAWTFVVPNPGRGEAMLRQAGWDGRKPVLAVCPIHAFWWPVKPDVLRGAAHWATGAWSDAHYAGPYFHNLSADIEARQDAYLDGIAEGLRAFLAETDAFVVLVGMEMLDRRSCDALNSRFRRPFPVFVSDDHDMYDMIALLRTCRWLLSSRYHALVCSMPAGVASAGITMDERIRNLMADRGTPSLALEVTDEALGASVLGVLRTLRDDEPAVVDGIGRCVAQNLVRMGQMGIDLVDHLRERHPELPIDTRFGGRGDPLAHLPPLAPHLVTLLEKHG
ncbi:MAG: hypothetical protein R3F61_05945 [Myxococcota bacterium]